MPPLSKHVNNNLDDDNSDNEEFIWGDSLQSHPPSDPDKPDNQSDNQNSDDQNSECKEHFNYEQLIKSLENEVKSGNLDSGYKLRLTALLQYLRLINHEEPKIKTSLSIAQQLNKGPYFARCLREWEKLVKNGETIPISKREKHCKIKSLLDDEDVQMQIATYLHENKFEFYVADFVDYVKNVVFPSLGIEQETTISTRMTRNWLNKMGFEFKQFKKGVYVDGHERPDVIAYRSKFLEQMASYEKLMPKFEDDNLEIQINPNLQENEHLHILVTHDETTFHSNDGRQSGWASHGEQPLRKKGRERSIHVSDFLCETIGRLQLSEEQKLSEVANNIPYEARVIMNPETNYDGWWNVELLVVDRAIPIFEATHPGAVAVFAFDNFTSHGAFSSDALIASHMNVGPGGKQPKMRNTIFNGNVQFMNFPDNHPEESLRGKQKGMKQILYERQLLTPGLKGFCKNKETIDNQCCMQHILENQPDFLAQKCMI
ncbi:17712_t:CDS:2 [Rhizophagus irregularis]|nr:17712_t:CDS:2 [Rhizophagus irregularis]